MSYVAKKVELKYDTWTVKSNVWDMVPEMYNEDWYSFVTRTSFQHCGLVPYGGCGAPTTTLGIVGMV